LAFYVPKDNIAATPLIIACINNHPQVASYLIGKGARVNYQNKVIHYLFCLLINNLLAKVSPQNNRSTPLHVACKNGYASIAKLLIESQAKLDIKDNVSVELLVACMGMGS
jgi:ankyrin repeat protein